MSVRSVSRRFVRLLDTPSAQVASAALAMAVAILALFMTAQWQSYERTVARAERDTRNAAFLLAEHAGRTFDSIAETLRAVDRLRTDVARGIYRSQASIYINLKTLQGGSPILREVGWFDEYGERVATSENMDPRRISIAREERFLVARDDRARDLYIAAPSRPSTDRAWRIDVSRRLENLDGSFAGLAGGTVDPEEFAKIYRSLDLGPGLSATLFRRDGIVLAHARNATDHLGRSVDAADLFRKHLPHAANGTYHGPSPLDGTIQIASYASVVGIGDGLVVKVGVPRHHVLAEFWRGLALQAVAVGLVLLMLLAGTWLIVAGLRRRERLQAQLTEATATANSARREAERANAAKSAFLAHMSHELRTPLNAIMGFGQMLELDYSGTLTRSQKEYAGHIVSSGQHLLDLVNEVLDLAGIESGRLPLSITRLVPGEVLAGLCDLMAPAAHQAGVDLVVRSAPDVPAVRADALRLRQALINLVSNAIKYNRCGGSVTVSALAMADARVRFVVADTGNGIALEQHASLFEPFHRLGAEYTAVEGTGLGLALTKRIVEAMDGTIAFSSEPNRGSSFWFDLPADVSATATPDAATPPRASASRPALAA